MSTDKLIESLIKNEKEPKDSKLNETDNYSQDNFTGGSATQLVSQTKGDSIRIND